MIISIERGGTFHAITMKNNSCKCAAMKTRIYNYFVSIQADTKYLTKEGFVINNELIQKYFDDTFGKNAPVWDAVSCEKMALKAACDIALLTSTISVTVRIKGSNGAWIMATCNGRNLRTNKLIKELFVVHKLHYRTFIFGGIILFFTGFFPELKVYRISLELLAGVLADRVFPPGELFHG